jgi:hypothetical protein
VIDEFLARAVNLGLTVKEMRLSSLPQGRHWHISKPGQPGTLEATWSDGELTFRVRSNRQGDWIPAALEKLSGED